MKFKTLVLSAVFTILATNAAFAVSDAPNEVVGKGHGSFTSYTTKDIASPKNIAQITNDAMKNATSQAKFLCGLSGGTSVTPIEGTVETVISPVYHVEAEQCRSPQFCDDTKERWFMVAIITAEFSCEK